MSKVIYRRALYLILVAFLIMLYASINSYFNADYQNKNVVSEKVDEINPQEGKLENVIELDSGNSDHYVIPSGEPIGIYVKSKGVIVIDVRQVVDSKGEVSVPCENFIKKGDYIDSVNGEKIEDKNDLIMAIRNADSTGLDITVKRGGQNLCGHVVPVAASGGYNMLGLLVKDDISGIGTLTYIDENGFGALGHSINDSDTGNLFDISDGAIYGVNLVNIVKADNNSPGRLEGMINYSKSNVLGIIENNKIYGITGHMTNKNKNILSSSQWMPTARPSEIKLGDAYIKSSILGESKLFKIKITDVNVQTDDGLKGIEIKVVDEELIGKTNGIVQGMSGSPIIQDGKVVGAVTHVFLSDSTKGYGIFIDNMME